MNLTNIINAWELDKSTIMLTDSPAFGHYEKATNVNFEIRSRVYIENPYKDVLNNKMMITIDIKDPDAKSSIYLTYNRLHGFINDLKLVLRDNLYSDQNGWFIKQQNHIQLNDKTSMSTVKIPIADGKEVTIKPWKSAASTEPSLILSIDNNNKHTTVDLPVYLFEIMVQKLCELKASFEVIRINLVNQFIMNRILNGNKSTNYIPPGMNDYITPPAPLIYTPPIDNSGSKPNEYKPQDVTGTPLIIPPSTTEPLIDNGPINHKTSISTFEGSVQPLKENFNVLFDDSKMNPEPEINMDNMFDDRTETVVTPPIATPVTDLKLIKNTSIQSEFLKSDAQLKLLLSRFMVAHTSLFTLNDSIYCSDYDNTIKLNQIKMYIDGLIKPIDKSNPNINHLLVKLRDIKIFPCYEYDVLYQETDQYNIVENIILGLYTAILRSSLMKGVTDNQVLFRTFITLNYESILVYMLSIHYNHLETIRKTGHLKQVVNNIIQTYKSKQMYMTEKLNAVIKEYTSNEIKLDSLFDSDTIYTLLEKVLTNIPPETKTEPIKQPESIANIPITTQAEKSIIDVPIRITGIAIEPVFSEVPNITLLMKKLIQDETSRTIVVNALMNCKKTIAQIVDLPNLEEVLNRIDGVPLLLKTIIMEWSPMGNLYHRDLERFKTYCRDKNAEFTNLNSDQEREIDLAVSLKISSMMSIKKIIDAHHIVFEKLLKDYDYYKNVENLYDDVKQQINKITTNPFTTGIIIEYYISKR